MPKQGGAPVRRDGLEIHADAEGCVVYDRANNRVHGLSRTAGAVLELCTGRLSASEIAHVVGDACGLSEPPEAEVSACLDAMRAQLLIADGEPRTARQR